MRHKYSILLIATILAIVVSVPAGGEPKKAGQGKKARLRTANLEDKFFGKANLILRKAEELGLSKEQEQAVKDLKGDVKKGMIMKRAEDKVIQLDVLAEMSQEKVDMEKVNKLIDRRYEVKSSLEKTYADSIVKLTGVLSEKQLQMLDDIRAPRAKAMKGSGTKSGSATK